MSDCESCALHRPLDGFFRKGPLDGFRSHRSIMRAHTLVGTGDVMVGHSINLNYTEKLQRIRSECIAVLLSMNQRYNMTYLLLLTTRMQDHLGVNGSSNFTYWRYGCSLRKVRSSTNARHHEQQR